jgi:Polyketide cyclase / dehydrase and lipid transport
MAFGLTDRSFNKSMRFLTPLSLVSLICLLPGLAKSSETGDDWKLATEHDGVTIYTRPHPGSGLKEFKAIGEIAAPSRAIALVIEDVEAYPNFMPYMAECRRIKRENNSLLSYQRISPKICRDRDLVVRTYISSQSTPGGLVYSNRWESASESMPAKKPGVIRVEQCQGSWLLEPITPYRTRATYSAYSDMGGLIPTFIANHFSLSAIGEIFAAVRKQVKEPKYRIIARVCGQ